MITSVTRKGREVLLHTDGERQIHLTPDRATAIARQIGRVETLTGPSRVLYQEERTIGKLVLIASPEKRLVVVALAGGQYGDIVAGWPYEEAREAAQALQGVALEISTRKTAERKKRAA